MKPEAAFPYASRLNRNWPPYDYSVHDGLLIIFAFHQFIFHPLHYYYSVFHMMVTFTFTSASWGFRTYLSSLESVRLRV